MDHLLTTFRGKPFADHSKADLQHYNHQLADGIEATSDPKKAEFWQQIRTELTKWL